MTEKTKVSICIPCYDMGAKGASYLSQSLRIISKQTYKNIEVVITDHSGNDSILKVISKFDGKVNTKYITNSFRSTGHSYNLNIAINHASGELVKILFQDDYLSGNDSIEQIVKAYQTKKFYWMASTCREVDHNGRFLQVHVPTISSNVHLVNNIGCPSVITFKRSLFEQIKFDNELIWLMDTDWYKRMLNKYGSPHFDAHPSVTIRRHKNQLSQILPDELKREESIKIIKRYSS